QAHVSRYIFHFLVQAGVLRPQRHQISKIVEERDAVQVDVGGDSVDGDRWVMSKLVRAQKSLFLAGHDQEKDRTARSGGQRLQRSGNLKDGCGSGSVVDRAMIDRLPLHTLTNA